MFYAEDDYDAIVLETFGIGGIPHTTALAAITDWIASGRTVVITTSS